ncbi:DUF6011 domain-containing protein [Paraburkholderia sediminicola]|uniref:DUF6011 domain-containing protein n=1 Tax=Paraburkholderia sediminicola TaxID=458836 RepID=UPI0038B842A0
MYLKSNAPEIKWIIANAAFNDFARSCDDYLLKTGTLTQPMFDAVRRGLSPVATPVDVSGVSRVVEAFANATESGLKRPKMFLGDFLFKLAPAAGRNKGAIYVTEEGEYLGKIADGQFHAARECTEAQRAAIVAVCADPKKAAVAFGQETGRCSCCGLELTNPESIANSIGPICVGRYGF